MITERSAPQYNAIFGKSGLLIAKKMQLRGNKGWRLGVFLNYPE
jgi:hypothetical protein